MIAVGWFVALFVLFSVSLTMLAVLFLRQQHVMVQALIARNASELVMLETATPKKKFRRLPESEGDFPDAKIRPMGL